MLEGRPREGARQVTSTTRAVLVLPKQEIHSKGYMVEAVMSTAPVAGQRTSRRETPSEGVPAALALQSTRVAEKTQTTAAEGALR